MKNKRIRIPRFARWILLLMSQYKKEYLMEADFNEKLEEKLIEDGKIRAHL